MANLLELRQRDVSDALGRRVGRYQLRMQRFQRLEPLHEHVKIIVGYLRLVVDIVKSAVMPYLAAQLVYLVLYIHGVLLLYVHISIRNLADYDRVGYQYLGFHLSARGIPRDNNIYIDDDLKIHLMLRLVYSGGYDAVAEFHL